MVVSNWIGFKVLVLLVFDSTLKAIYVVCMVGISREALLSLLSKVTGDGEVFVYEFGSTIGEGV